MRLISSSLAKVKPLCRGATVWGANTIPTAGTRTQIAPAQQNILLSRATSHKGMGSALLQGSVSNPMQESAASHRRRMHAAVGQGPLMGPIEELHVRDLQEILERMSQEGADSVQLIDVREDFEHQTASLPGFKLLPMSRLQDWAQNIHDEMDSDKETVLLCHHGVRSMRVAGFLASQGFQKLRNVTGGIDAYSREVDSSVPQY